jgi:DNA ligase-1
MSQDGKPHFTFHAFDDYLSSHEYFCDRFQFAYPFKKDFDGPIQMVEHTLIHNLQQLISFERDCVEVKGWEGIMLRDPKGSYKFGRSTTKEGILLKMKRFFDTEAEIIGFEERMHNTNEATKNNLGRTERGTAKNGLIGTDSLGAFVVRLCDNPTVEFNIGTGFSEQQRQDYWSTRHLLNGQKVTFKYQELSKDSVPRFPVFVGFRRDLENS